MGLTLSSPSASSASPQPPGWQGKEILAVLWVTNWGFIAVHILAFVSSLKSSSWLCVSQHPKPGVLQPGES